VQSANFWMTLLSSSSRVLYISVALRGVQPSQRVWWRLRQLGWCTCPRYIVMAEHTHVRHLLGYGQVFVDLEAQRSSETSVNIYRSARRNIPETFSFFL